MPPPPHPRPVADALPPPPPRPKLSSRHTVWNRLLASAEARPPPTKPEPHHFLPRGVGDDHLRRSFEHALINQGLTITASFSLNLQQAPRKKKARSRRCRPPQRLDARIEPKQPAPQPIPAAPVPPPPAEPRIPDDDGVLNIPRAPGLRDIPLAERLKNDQAALEARHATPAVRVPPTPGTPTKRRISKTTPLTRPPARRPRTRASDPAPARETPAAAARQRIIVVTTDSDSDSETVRMARRATRPQISKSSRRASIDGATQLKAVHPTTERLPSKGPESARSPRRSSRRTARRANRVISVTDSDTDDEEFVPGKLSDVPRRTDHAMREERHRRRSGQTASAGLSGRKARPKVVPFTVTSDEDEVLEIPMFPPSRSAAQDRDSDKPSDVSTSPPETCSDVPPPDAPSADSPSPPLLTLTAAQSRNGTQGEPEVDPGSTEKQFFLVIPKTVQSPDRPKHSDVSGSKRGSAVGSSLGPWNSRAIPYKVARRARRFELPSTVATDSRESEDADRRRNTCAEKQSSDTRRGQRESGKIGGDAHGVGRFEASCTKATLDANEKTGTGTAQKSVDRTSIRLAQKRKISELLGSDDRITPKSTPSSDRRELTQRLSEPNSHKIADVFEASRCAKGPLQATTSKRAIEEREVRMVPEQCGKFAPPEKGAALARRRGQQVFDESGETSAQYSLWRTAESLKPSKQPQAEVINVDFLSDSTNAENLDKPSLVLNSLTRKRSSEQGPSDSIRSQSVRKFLGFDADVNPVPARPQVRKIIPARIRRRSNLRKEPGSSVQDFKMEKTHLLGSNASSSRKGEGSPLFLHERESRKNTASVGKPQKYVGCGISSSPYSRREPPGPIAILDDDQTRRLRRSPATRSPYHAGPTPFDAIVDLDGLQADGKGANAIGPKSDRGETPYDNERPRKKARSGVSSTGLRQWGWRTCDILPSQVWEVWGPKPRQSGERRDGEGMLNEEKRESAEGREGVTEKENSLTQKPRPSCFNTEDGTNQDSVDVFELVETSDSEVRIVPVPLSKARVGDIRHCSRDESSPSTMRVSKEVQRRTQASVIDSNRGETEGKEPTNYPLFPSHIRPSLAEAAGSVPDDDGSVSSVLEVSDVVGSDEMASNSACPPRS